MLPRMIVMSKASLLFVVCATGFVGGCSYIKTPVLAFSDNGDYLEPTVGDGLVASPESYIPDVPFPIGFKAVPSQCTSSFDGRVRTITHLYQGHAKLGETEQFYMTQLPRNDWRFTDSTSVGETTSTTYTKGAERLTVQTDHSYGVMTITIHIGAD